MELYVGIDVFFRSIPMPLFMKGFLKCDNGIYYIYVNSNHSLEEQQKAIKHEYTHLIRKDIEKENTNNVERRNK